MNIGTYCLGTKYEDGDAGDPWGLGFYAGFAGSCTDLFRLVDADQNLIRWSGYRKIAPISNTLGHFLWNNRVELEQVGEPLWELVEAIRDVF